MIRMLIADDHAIVREGLKQVLVEIDEGVEIDEAANGQDVLGKVWEKDYDLVVLDIAMPGRSGLDIIKQLKSERPDLNILVLSMHPEEQYAVRMLKAGASGYLTKRCTLNELLEAVRKVSAGMKYVSSSLLEKLASHLDRREERPVLERLSDREYEVMCLIASGKTVKEIADELTLSIKTISTYRTRLLEKLGLSNNAQITQYSIQNRLIEPVFWRIRD